MCLPKWWTEGVVQSYKECCIADGCQLIKIARSGLSGLTRAQSGMSVLLDQALFRRLSWLGHLGRTANDRLPKQLLVSQVSGHRLRGFSRKKWPQLLQADLDRLGILNSIREGFS